MGNQVHIKRRLLKKLLELYRYSRKDYMDVNNLKEFLRVDANELCPILNKLLKDGVVLGKGFGIRPGNPGETVGIACNPDRIDQIKKRISDTYPRLV